MTHEFKDEGDWDEMSVHMAMSQDSRFLAGVAGEVSRQLGVECRSRYEDSRKHLDESPLAGTWEVEHVKGRDLYALIAKDDLSPSDCYLVAVFCRRPDAVLAAQSLWMQSVVRRVLRVFDGLTPAEIAELPVGLGAPFIDLGDARRCLRASEGK